MRFVARMAASGIVRSVASYPELAAVVDDLLAKSRGTGMDAAADRARVDASVARFADAVEPLRRGR
jgi:hypothetical protein